MLMAVKPWRSIAIVGAALCGLATIAWTSLGKWDLPSIAPRQSDYYNLLVNGFEQRHLALAIEVPEAIKQAHDPWDPLKRPPVHTPADVSYFNGHYYLYFGVAPAVVLYWPFRAVTGHDLPPVYGTLAFSLGAFLIATWLWLRIARDHFSKASILTQAAGILAIGLAGGQLVLARRTSVWEPPILAGYLFIVCMLASGYRAMRSQRPWCWLAISGLSLGLAVGSRPTLAVAGTGLAIIVVAVSAGGLGDGRGIGALRRFALAALAAGLPLAGVAAGLLAYNDARFGNPFEFGIKYQLSAVDLTKARLFSLAYVPYNFSNYFLTPPQWDRYFPFVHPGVTPIRTPPGFYGSEFIYGALTVCPILWWILCLPAAFSPGRRGTGLAAFTFALVATAGTTTAILLCFNTATPRYQVDFMPWLVWLGILGWASLEDRASSLPRVPAAITSFRAAFFASAAISLASAYCVSCDVYGLLAYGNPDAYRRISRVLDAPTALVERLFKFQGGPIELDIVFPSRPPNAYEPLMVTGVEYQKDYVFVHYKSATLVDFGIAPTGGSAVTGPDVTVEPGHRYRMRIECGALYPPEGHPLFDGWNELDVHALKKWATIELDGRPVYDRRISCHEASPGTIELGKDLGAGPYGAKFSGLISNIRRGAWTPHQMDLRLSGDFELKLTLPDDDVSTTQPLMIAGHTGNADLLGLRIADHLHYRLVYECWGAGLLQSETLAAPETRTVSLRVRFGPLLDIDEGSPLSILRRSIVVWQDGSPVWWQRTMRPLDPRPTSGFSGNTIGSSAMAPEFEGRRNSALRTRPPAGWHRGPFSAIEMELAGRGGGSEPVVVTGTKGHSDTFAINWLPNGQAELIYDHSGGAVTISPKFNWPDGGLHRLNVRLPAFPLLDAPKGPDVGTGGIRVQLDGKELWQHAVQFFLAPSASLTIGRNSASSTFTRDEMECVVVDLKQL